MRWLTPLRASPRCRARSLALGLGHAAVSARMNGHKDFTYTELMKTAEVLGVSLRDLLPAEEKETLR
jgi:transcriptional regulator with XRE-family HTH domain